MPRKKAEPPSDRKSSDPRRSPSPRPSRPNPRSPCSHPAVLTESAFELQEAVQTIKAAIPALEAVLAVCTRAS